MAKETKIFYKNGINLNEKLQNWHVHATKYEKDDNEIKDRFKLVPYEHYRTRIGSPSINRHSFTDEEIDKFKCENDGFPLPSTADEIKAFNKQVFAEQIAQPREGGYKKLKPKKQDRQRSKSATNIPDPETIKLRLQKTQTPSRPKFIEHLINRVVSKRVGKSCSNGLIKCGDEPIDLHIEEPLSPDSEQCLQHAEAIVEEFLACSARPASVDSTDSGQGSSLVDSSNDFISTQNRTSWSTPASPTLYGIVKERLKTFQDKKDVANTDSHGIANVSPFLPQNTKSFKNADFEHEIREINDSIKNFYTSISEDEDFKLKVMESGYVKTLVAKINENKFQICGENNKHLEVYDASTNEHNANVEGGITKLNIGEVDPEWNEWEKEIENNEESDNNQMPSVNFMSNASETVSLSAGFPEPTLRISRTSSVASSSSTNSPKSSRANSSCDSDSHDEDEIPKDKLHQIAFELLTTERTYVERLHLLDQVFQARVLEENKNGNFLPPEIIPQMFANIRPIYTFHHDFLLPDLEERMKNWLKEKKIGDILAKLAPFLKLYTDYVKNYDNAMSLIDKWTSQAPKFAALLQEIQKKPDCKQLTLQHHMLGPIQRIPRYELLLKDYLKRLEPDALDRPDAQKALDLVTQAACHSNTAMKKLDKFNKLLSIIPRLNGEGTNDLISPTRELFKEGPITKISARSGEKQARYLFLFNDLLLVCSEQITGSYKLRARLSVCGMQMLAGENKIIPNTFCVQCIEKTIEFLDEANNGSGLDWYATFQNVIADFQKRKLGRVVSSESDEGVTDPSQLGLISPKWVQDVEVTMCMGCQDKFTPLKRRHHCRACGKVFCSTCSSHKVCLKYDNNRVNKVCQKCHKILTMCENNSADDNGSMSPRKHGVNQVFADEASVLASYLNTMDKGRNWVRRWISVRDDFAMYFYKKNKDPKALQTLPLPGHEVNIIGNSHDRSNVFSLTHKDTYTHYFQADSEAQMNHWVHTIEKLIKLELPSEEDKRLSTHSIGSSQSSSSSGHSVQS